MKRRRRRNLGRRRRNCLLLLRLEKSLDATYTRTDPPPLCLGRTHTHTGGNYQPKLVLIFFFLGLFPKNPDDLEVSCLETSVVGRQSTVSQPQFPSSVLLKIINFFCSVLIRFEFIQVPPHSRTNERSYTPPSGTF